MGWEWDRGVSSKTRPIAIPIHSLYIITQYLFVIQIILLSIFSLLLCTGINCNDCIFFFTSEWILSHLGVHKFTLRFKSLMFFPLLRKFWLKASYLNFPNTWDRPTIYKWFNYVQLYVYATMSKHASKEYNIHEGK